MKKKGFTLVELLAVVVVLAIIIIIAVPIVKGFIKNARMNAVKDSAYGLLESGRVYYSNHSEDIDTYVQFQITNGEVVSEEKIQYKGTITNAILIVDWDENMAVCVDDGKYYAKKNMTETEITADEGTCDTYDPVSGIISVNGASHDTYTKEIEERDKMIADLNAQLEAKDKKYNDFKTNIAARLKSRGYQVGDTKDSTILNAIPSISSGSMFYIDRTSTGLWKNNTGKTIDIKRKNSSTYDTYTYCTDTSSDKCYVSSVSLLRHFTSGFQVYAISDNVIGFTYTTLGTNKKSWNHYDYFVTYVWNEGENRWVKKSNVKILVTYYAEKGDPDNPSPDVAYDTTTYLYELPFQDQLSHNAYFTIYEDRGGWTTTAWIGGGARSLLTVNKVTGEAVVSNTKSYTWAERMSNNRFYTSTNFETAQTAQYDRDGDGWSYTKYTNSTWDDISTINYYIFTVDSSGAKTTTGDENSHTPYMDLRLYGYKAGSGTKYRVTPKLTLDTSAKTLTAELTYRQISPSGFDNIQSSSNTTTRQYSISNALPDNKTVSSSTISKATSVSQILTTSMKGRSFLDYTTGKYYAIYKFNDNTSYNAYLYVTGELVETLPTNGGAQHTLELAITGVRYSDTFYTGNDAISKTKLNIPDDHYEGTYDYYVSYSR